MGDARALPQAAPVLCVHDEIVLECPAERADEASAWLRDCMVRGMGGFITKVPVVVEATIARDWAGTPDNGPDDSPGCLALPRL